MKSMWEAAKKNAVPTKVIDGVKYYDFYEVFKKRWGRTFELVMEELTAGHEFFPGVNK